MAYLRPLSLNPPQTPRAIEDSVIRDDLTGVYLAEGTDDAATGKDNISTHVS